MEVAGLAVGTIAIADPLIKTIRGLRQIFDAMNGASELLDRLEHDGHTISFYISSVDNAITQDPSGYPDTFIRWFEDEKKLLERSTAQIEDYARRIEQRSQSAPLIHGMKTIFDVTDISKVQEQIKSSISVIGHMMSICNTAHSFDSRAAALRGEKSKRLRAQTSSSLAGHEESFCNVSSSFDEFWGVSCEDPRPFQEELKRSKPYRRVALKELFSPSNRNEGNLSSSAPTDPQASGQRGQIQPPLDDMPPQIEISAAMSTTLVPLTLSTHSSSLQASSSLTHRGWSTTGDTANSPTSITVETDGSSSFSDNGPENRQSYVPIRVEIEGLESRTTKLERVDGDVDIDAVRATIKKLRTEILTAARISTVRASTRSKDRGIIAYKTIDASEVCERWALNRHTLTGAFVEVDSGKYARFEVFQIFALQQDQEESQVAVMFLDVRTPSDRKNKGQSSLPFPSVETVLQSYNGSTSGAEALSLLLEGSSASLTWSLKWFARGFIIQEMVYVVMPDGPEWQQRHHVAKGGSSDVWKVQLSPSHCSHFRDAGPFALKVLEPGHEHTFRRELEALKRLAPRNHPHIVTLLMAYEQKGAYHLLFPWADGSLSTFWQSTSTERRSEDAWWMVSQCSGIADGLETIHSYRGETNLKGRHGDLKPDNILWYKTESDKLGRLVISDFGLTRFHGNDNTLTNPRRQRGGTLAYAPPEFSRLGSDSSGVYDIWSMGCIFLEFVTWLVSGWEGLTGFYENRRRLGDGQGGSGIIRHETSANLHLSLHNQLERIRAILGQRRRLDTLRIGDGLINMLIEYCDVVEWCLSLRPNDRPTAREVAECLRMTSNKISVIISGTSTLAGRLARAPLVKIDHNISAQSSYAEATSALTIAWESAMQSEMSPSDTLLARSAPHIISKKGPSFLRYSSNRRDNQTKQLHFDFFTMLLNLNVDVAVANDKGWTPPMAAAANGHDKAVELLLAVNARSLYSDFAAILLDLDVDMAGTNDKGWTPLMAAAANGHVQAIRLLLEKGADVAVENDKGWTPPMAAAANGHDIAVEILLAVNARNLYPDFAAILLDYDADMAGANDKGWTPLMAAAANGHVQAIRLLLEKGADVAVENDKGWMPLMVAVANEHVEAVKLFIQTGADMAVANNHGWTTLISVPLNDYSQVVKLPLDDCADVGVKDSDGWTLPITTARDVHTEEVNSLLEEGTKDDQRHIEYDHVDLFGDARGGNKTIDKQLLEEYNMDENSENVISHYIWRLWTRISKRL